MASVFDFCPEVIEFEHQSRYYVLFWTNALGKFMSLLIPQAPV